MPSSTLRWPSRFKVAMAGLVLTSSLRANAADFRPTFSSDVLAPEEKLILPLLKAACGEGVRTITAEGKNALGCGDGSMDEILASRNKPRRYPWMPHTLWQAESVIFGHFLSPKSEDAAINCFGCESHPDLWGGTLLLTKNAGGWEPVWYKSGIITRHCRRVSLATGREILFCEETDGGMGYTFHRLYLIDFTRPRFGWTLLTNSYGAPMLGGVQTQSIDRVSFERTAQAGLLVRVYARHGRIELPPDYASTSLPRPKLSRYEIDFRLEGETFKVTQKTARFADLFGTASW